MNEITQLIGIDPSVKTAGVAIYEPATNNLKLYSGELNACLSWLDASCDLRKCIAYVENPDLNSTTFGSSGLLHSTLKMYKIGRITEAVAILQLHILLKRSQHVGKSQASAQVFIQFLKSRNVPVIEVAPAERMRADKPFRSGSKLLPVGLLVMPTKTSAHQFKVLTGYKGSSNEHSRDAATLVWGKSVETAVMKLRKQNK